MSTDDTVNMITNVIKASGVDTNKLNIDNIVHTIKEQKSKSN
jgi:hypothetical protein